jgi:O-antigen/teichoic acid export membrane protein
MTALAVGVIVVCIVLINKFNYKPKFVFYDSIIRKIGRYSFGNYVAGFIGGLPTLLLPLIITNSLHPEITAYYYMAMMIANILFMVPNTTSSSLFAEGSYNEKELKKHVKKSIKLISLFIIPAIILILFFGKYALLLFGKEYSEQGYQFLSVLAISGIFVSINSVFGTLFKVKKRVKELIVMSGISTVLILGLSYVLLNKGLIGIGVAWITGQVIISGIYIVRELGRK